MIKKAKEPKKSLTPYRGKKAKLFLNEINSVSSSQAIQSPRLKKQPKKRYSNS